MGAVLWPIVQWFTVTIVAPAFLLSVVTGLMAVASPIAWKILVAALPIFNNAGGPGASFDSMVGDLEPIIQYCFHVFRVDVGFQMVLSAYITRFTIRRIPFIG